MFSYQNRDIGQYICSLFYVHGNGISNLAINHTSRWPESTCI